jgi:hypothetical protein
MKWIHAALPVAASLALAACSQSTTEDDAADADGADTTAVVPGPTTTETAVVPGGTSTVAVPVPGATVTTNADGDRVTIDRDGVEVDVGDEDTRVKADIDP